MSRLYQVSLFFFAVLTVFLFSSGSSRNISNAVYIENGYFQMQSDGIVKNNLQGSVYFKKNHGLQKNLLENDVVEIVFEYEDSGITNEITFIVTDTDKLDLGLKGDYKIVHLNSMLSNNFNGAYAYADLKSVDEVPFFAKDGKISILNERNEEVLGQLSVEFINANNKTFSITGLFNAKNNYNNQ